LHALIIETDSLVVLAIEDSLADIGYTSFDSATSKAEARELSDVRCPDLITSAIHVGQESGFEAVRGACAGRHIPFLFITSTSWEARVHDRGIPVIQKPFTGEGLRQAVETAVSAPMPASW
jgi:DNA-binding response OmpR family regulator